MDKMDKFKLKISICNENGEVLDMFDVFTPDEATTVRQIVSIIEDNTWTDEADFDEYLKEMNSDD